MADDRMAALREKVAEFRGGLSQVKMKEMSGPSITPGRAPDQPADAVRERYRHIQEHKGAAVVKHPSAGYGHKPEPQSAERTQAGNGKSESKEQPKPGKEQEMQKQLKDVAARMKEAGVKAKEVKQSDPPKPARAEAQRRPGRDR